MIQHSPNANPADQAAELIGVDHVEFWVGNAKQAAFYYQHAFGFQCVAYAGPETGLKDRASYVMRQNDIQLVLTTSLLPDDEIARHVKLHGDGVKDVVFRVRDVDAAYQALVARGAKGVAEPATFEDGHGKVRRAARRAGRSSVNSQASLPSPFTFSGGSDTTLALSVQCRGMWPSSIAVVETRDSMRSR